MDKQTQALVAQADDYKTLNVVVTTAEEYSAAADKLKALKAYSKQLEDKRKELVAPFIKGKADLDEFFNKPKLACAAVIDRINLAMNKYREAEELRARKEQERIAEMQRKEAERLTKLAEKATAKGDDWKAEELQEKLEEVQKQPAAIVVANIPQTVTSRKVTWQFEIIDESLLPREFLMPDTVKIGKFVREKQAFAKISGVRTFTKETNY